MVKLNQIFKEWILEDIYSASKLEEDFFELNEIKIDPLNSYEYKEVNYIQGKGNNKAWGFDDRCGNTIYAIYIPSINEFKTGYKIEGIDTLIFQPERFPQVLDKIKPCPDDKKLGTIYKILINEIVPFYLLDKKPNKLYFNPVSSTRDKLVRIVINKLTQQYPQLIRQDNYIIYK